MASPSVQLREQVQAVLGNRCDAAFSLKAKDKETIPSVVGDIPRGALTEISGPISSGRTSVLFSLLAALSTRQEFCALLDVSDSFDPATAEAAGVLLSQVLWIRCGGNVENALKAADMLAQAGGFGLIAFDLGDTPIKTVHRIPLASWFRLRHAVDNTRAMLIVLAQQSHAQSCASLKIELRPARTIWQGLLPGRILNGFQAVAQCIRDHRGQEQQFGIAR